MLEEAESAMARGATILGKVNGHGSAFDCQQRQNAEAEVKPAATAVARAVQIALDDAELEAADIDVISSSANGHPWGDRVEALGLDKVFGGLTEAVPVTAIKSMLGESLGAASAIQAVAMVAALSDGRLPGIAGLEEIEPALPLEASSKTQDVVVHHALLNGAGMDGNCCSLVMGR
jgi:3-oxoacyl-[acyl-carrier-protein] synthase II